MVKIQENIDFFFFSTGPKEQIPCPAANVQEGGFFLVIEHL